MARDVTLSGKGGSLAPLPSISPELRKILDAQIVGNYGGDEGTNFGADFREGAWRRPKWLPEPLRAEAEKVLPPHEYWATPATVPFMRDWLLLLFGACRKNSDQDWDVISRAYPSMLSGWPAWCFHPEILPAAGMHFHWFPSLAELTEWLMPRRLHIENEAYRLRYLSKLPTQPKAKREAAPQEKREPWKPTSEEDRAKVRQICAEMRGRLDAVPFRASLRPEDDRKGDFRPIGDAAVSEARARRDPSWAAYLETSRRMAMARDAADKAGDADGWARFMVPLDQPMHGDLRAFYGHACPGHEQPAVPSNEGAKSDMAPKSKARSFGEGENGPSLSPASDAQEGAA